MTLAHCDDETDARSAVAALGARRSGCRGWSSAPTANTRSTAPPAVAPIERRRGRATLRRRNRFLARRKMGRRRRGGDGRASTRGLEPEPEFGERGAHAARRPPPARSAPAPTARSAVARAFAARGRRAPPRRRGPAKPRCAGRNRRRRSPATSRNTSMSEQSTGRPMTAPSTIGMPKPSLRLANTTPCASRKYGDLLRVADVAGEDKYWRRRPGS